MASGRQQFFADLTICVVSIPLIYYEPTLFKEIVIGNLIGTLVTCDIDSEANTYNEALLSEVVRKFLILCGRRMAKVANDVKILYRLQNAFTAPYGVLCPHRSWLSHAPIASTITITGYLWLLYYLYCQIRNIEAIPLLTLYQLYEVAFYTIAVHHFFHYVMDGGLILFFGKQVYTLTYPFYYLTTKLFPQGEHD